MINITKGNGGYKIITAGEYIDVMTEFIILYDGIRRLYMEHTGCGEKDFKELVKSGLKELKKNLGKSEPIISYARRVKK